MGVVEVDKFIAMEVLALNFIVVSGAVLASSVVSVVEAKNFFASVVVVGCVDVGFVDVIIVVPVAIAGDAVVASSFTTAVGVRVVEKIVVVEVIVLISIA